VHHHHTIPKFQNHQSITSINLSHSQFPWKLFFLNQSSSIPPWLHLKHQQSSSLSLQTTTLAALQFINSIMNHSIITKDTVLPSSIQTISHPHSTVLKPSVPQFNNHQFNSNTTIIPAIN
jgi:hypothetical protein